MNIRGKTLLFIITAVLLSGCHTHMSSYGAAPTNDSIPPVGLTSDGQYLMGTPQGAESPDAYESPPLATYNPFTNSILVPLSDSNMLYDIGANAPLVGIHSPGGPPLYYHTGTGQFVPGTGLTAP